MSIGMCKSFLFLSKSQLLALLLPFLFDKFSVVVRPQVTQALYMRSSIFVELTVLSRICLICIFTRICMEREIGPKIANNYG